VLRGISEFFLIW